MGGGGTGTIGETECRSQESSEGRREKHGEGVTATPWRSEEINGESNGHETAIAYLLTYQIWSIPNVTMKHSTGHNQSVIPINALTFGFLLLPNFAPLKSRSSLTLPYSYPPTKATSALS